MSQWHIEITHYSSSAYQVESSLKFAFIWKPFVLVCQQESYEKVLALLTMHTGYLESRKNVDSDKRSQRKSRKSQSESLKRRTKKHTRRQPFSFYIFKLLKHSNGDLSISSKAMLIMDSFINDMLAKIVREASRLASLEQKATLTAREIQTAVRLLLPGTLATHAVSEGAAAVARYATSDTY